MQMPKELALRFCTAVEPYVASALSEWAAGSTSQDAETRSTALLQVHPSLPVWPSRGAHATPPPRLCAQSCIQRVQDLDLQQGYA